MVKLQQMSFALAADASNRGHRVGGKVPVLWLVKRNGQVLHCNGCSHEQPCSYRSFENKLLQTASFIRYTYRSYDVLDVSEFRHYRINHSKLFAHKQDRINGTRELLESGEASCTQM